MEKNAGDQEQAKGIQCVPFLPLHSQSTPIIDSLTAHHSVLSSNSNAIRSQMKPSSPTEHSMPSHAQTLTTFASSGVTSSGPGTATHGWSFPRACTARQVTTQSQRTTSSRYRPARSRGIDSRAGLPTNSYRGCIDMYSRGRHGGGGNPLRG